MSKNSILLDRFEEAYAQDPLRFDSLPGVSKGWTPQKLVYLLEELKTNPSITHEALAKKLGFERSTITRKIKAVDWEAFEHTLQRLSTATHKEFIQDEAEKLRVAMLEKQARQRQNKEIMSAAWAKQVHEHLIQTTQERKKISLPVPAIIRPRKHGTPEHAVLLLSDLHVGQAFTLEDTNGLNEYSVASFVRRAANLRKAVVEIGHNLHSKLYPIPTLHVLALGDIVQGSNLAGEWGPAYNTMDIIAQTEQAAETISDLLVYWSNYFEKVEFSGVMGNHGRAGATKNSDKLSANFDMTVYGLVKRQMSAYKNVSVNYTNCWYQQKSINGTEVLMVHGDGLKTNNVATLLREEMKLQSLVASKKPFNVLAIGHFHSFGEIETNRGSIMINGSFVGGDIYSMHKLSALSKPTQTMFGVHPERGVTWKYNIDLESRRE